MSSISAHVMLEHEQRDQSVHDTRMLYQCRPLYGLAGSSACFSLSLSLPKLPRRSKEPLFRPTCVSARAARKAICTIAPLRIRQSHPSKPRRKDTVPTADTIYALSTGPGRAAIAVIRISGPACLDIYGAVCPDRPFPHPRTATLRKLKDPKDYTRILDPGALILYFPGPKTVTGDDVLELHVHGGPAVVRSVLEAVPNCVDSRPRRRTADYSLIRAAEPGEFTKRAFYNGRLDLTQAEALGETLAAETEQQRRLAIAGADSGLATRYEQWRQTLLYARGELEALIDFSEDQHFDESPADFMHSVSAQVSKLDQQIRLHIQNASRGELLRHGISIALLGAPNAGKSSLLNQIAGREAAIVSAEAGTTRDIVDVTVDIGGWLVRLGDMAGLRADDNDWQAADVASSKNTHSIGQVELEGIRRAKQRALQSDLVIVVVSLIQNEDGAIELSVNPELVQAVEQCRTLDKAMVFVINKIDLLPAQHRPSAESGLRQRILDSFPGAQAGDIYLLSCKDAASSLLPTFNQASTPKLPDAGGVQTFLRGLLQTFSTMTSAATESDPSLASITTAFEGNDSRSYWTASLSVTHRQSMYLQRCRRHLEDFLAACATSPADGYRLSSHHVDGHADLVGEKPARIGRIRREAEDEFDVVTAAEHLRYAAECLAKITGRGEGGDVEDVLGVVFEK